jgi:hypothetical protein
MIVSVTPSLGLIGKEIIDPGLILAYYSISTPPSLQATSTGPYVALSSKIAKYIYLII